jgi:hypothetical protein
MTADGVPLCAFLTAGTADQRDVITSALSLANLDEAVSSRNAIAPDNDTITLIADILEADVDVDKTAKTITWKHKDTGVTLYSKTYDDVGDAQGLS